MEPFGLTIGLWMICSAHCCFTRQQFGERLPKLRCEFRIAVTDNGGRHAKLAYPLLKQNRCDLFSIEGGFDRHKFYKFAKPIDDAKYCIVAL